MDQLCFRLCKERINIYSRGFAHGFLALENNTKIKYIVDKPYKKDAECAIICNDMDVSIDWPCEIPILSDKDSNSLTFSDNLMLNNF
jgi:dTDP-4-dehydrorhamnose 3,5-epimerase